jgi:hypothetical protein
MSLPRDIREITFAVAVTGGVAFAIALGIVAAGCYRPSVASGRVYCGPPQGKRCPDGFECAGDVCVTKGSAPGTGGAAGTGGARGSGGRTGGDGSVDQVSDAGSDAGDALEPCIEPRESCVPMTGVSCDPYCRTGCSDCRQKCSINTAGVLVCSAGSRRNRAVGETCLISSPGQGNQSDDCGPGLVCMADCGGGGGARCYAFCRSDVDCLFSACTRTAPGGVHKVCEVPFTTCNPQDGRTGCASTTESCYLLASQAAPLGGQRTVCDCSMAAAGVSEPCTDSRECLPGLVCPVGGLLGSGYCRRVCSPTSPTTCQGTVCRPYGVQWGYCF